tara:strand:+ start:1870 stop:2082 length:213 start_codon:yes stop_codon:yes gene_type:complete
MSFWEAGLANHAVWHQNFDSMTRTPIGGLAGGVSDHQYMEMDLFRSKVAIMVLRPLLLGLRILSDKVPFV